MSRTIQCCKLLARFAARMFMKIQPMESNLLNSASDFLHHTHFYFNILSLAAKISARWLHCHKHCTCYSIVSCSPLILIGAHFSSLAINQLHDLSLFKKMTKKQPCSEINAFKNSDPGSSTEAQRGGEEDTIKVPTCSITGTSPSPCPCSKLCLAWWEWGLLNTHFTPPSLYS